MGNKTKSYCNTCERNKVSRVYYPCQISRSNRTNYDRCHAEEKGFKDFAYVPKEETLVEETPTGKKVKGNNLGESARKNLETMVNIIGWDFDRGNLSSLITPIKWMLKTYIRFKEVGRRYEKLERETNLNAPLETLYFFNKDVSEIIAFLEKNKYGEGIDTFMSDCQKYYYDVKAGLVNDLHGKRGKEANFEEIKATLREIRDFSAFPNHSFTIDGE